MRQIAQQNIANYYPVTLSICEPIQVNHEEEVFEHGKWYVGCGGEGHYTNSMKEACEWFSKLVNFAMNEAKTA